VPLREMAVLYRSNLFSRDLETALRAEGLPYRVLGGTAFYETKEVKDLLAYLRVCANPFDEISLRRVINFPPRGIGPKSVAALAQGAEAQQIPFYRALPQAERLLGNQAKIAEAVRQFLELMERYTARFHQGERLGETLRELVAELGIEHHLRQSLSPSSKAIDRRVARLHSLIESIQGYCQRVEKPSLNHYLNRLALAHSEADSEDAAGGELVTLSTLHGAKGLEFRLVILAGVEEGYLPHSRTLNPHQHDIEGGDIAEERRLCYVGITRARDELVITRCTERLVRGKPQPRTPSRFLDPIPPEFFRLEDLSRPPEPEVVRNLLADLFAKLQA
jgi:DNA helicase-2/ATP-dependent DNA helicase PcrA